MNIQDEDQQSINLLEEREQNQKDELFSVFFTQLNEVMKRVRYDVDCIELGSILRSAKFLPDGLMAEVRTALSKRKDKKVLTMLKGFQGRQFLAIGGLKCLSVFFLFCIPWVMNLLTNEVRKLDGSDQSVSRNLIVGYSLLLVVATLLATITESQYSYQIIRLEAKCRHLLVETVYESAMSRKANQRRASEHDVVNLVTIDVNSILNFFLSFHECWSLVVKLVIGLAMLYVQMRQAILVGFCIAVGLMSVNFVVAKLIGRYFARGMAWKDKRMLLLREFVQAPKQIKYLKWERKWHDSVTHIRQKEFRLVEATKWLDSLCVLFWAVTNTLISTGTLLYFGPDLQQQNVFTIIYLFSLLTNPLNSLPWTVSGMLQARHSFQRMNAYLCSATEFNAFQEQVKGVLERSGELRIEYRNAEFAWFEGESTPSKSKTVPLGGTSTLRIANLRIEPCKLTLVIGPTNAGKTSFLSTLLDEIKLVSGQFTRRVNGPTSYVPQVHWMSQDSVRGNIAMEAEVQLGRYLECLKCSQLEQGLDAQDAGPEGQKLSGGQRQRVALCRALYHDAHLYVLDDPFSSLDPAVADKVFLNAVRHYLGSSSKTVVLSLNDGYVPRYINYADNVVLVKDGVVTDDKGQIQEYLSSIDEDVQIDQGQVQAETKDTLSNALDKQKLPQPSNRSSLESMKFYLSSLGVCNTVLIAVSLVMMQASFNLYDAWLNSYLNGKPFFLLNHSFISTLLLLTLLDTLAKSARAFTFAYGNLYQARQIFKKLLDKVIYGSARLFDKEDSGQILSRLSGDQNVVDLQFPFELNLVCNNVVNFIGTFMLLAMVEWLLIVPMGVALWCFKAVQDMYRPTSLPLRRLDAQVTADLLTLVNDHSKGAQVIVASESSARYYKRFEEKLADMIRVSWTGKCIGLWLQVRLQLVAALMVLSILALCVLQLYAPALSLSPSTLQLLLYYSLTKISLFKDLTLSLTTCERELIAYERIRQYMHYEQDQAWEQTGGGTPSSAPKPTSLLIRFTNVWLDYGDHLDPDPVYALKGVTLDIHQGQMVAFCGRTGSGKSSILSLIFQLYPVTLGTIHFKYPNMRTRISVIPQNGLVFKGTLLQNLGGTDYLQQIQEVLTTCPIHIDLDQQLESDGKNISQGKRQVISFIRALLENQDIICLDEATASVDAQIEEWIMQTLHHKCRQQRKTVITISHKVEKLRDYDTIYYLEDGQIKEQGDWDTLTKTNSRFNELRNLV